MKKILNSLIAFTFLFAASLPSTASAAEKGDLTTTRLPLRAGQQGVKLRLPIYKKECDRRHCRRVYDYHAIARLVVIVEPGVEFMPRELVLALFELKGRGETRTFKVKIASFDSTRNFEFNASKETLNFSKENPIDEVFVYVTAAENYGDARNSALIRMVKLDGLRSLKVYLEDRLARWVRAGLMKDTIYDFKLVENGWRGKVLLRERVSIRSILRTLRGNAMKVRLSLHRPLSRHRSHTLYYRLKRKTPLMNNNWTEWKEFQR